MLDARICSQEQLQQMDSFAQNTMFKRVPWVYAHGKLADDLGSDVVLLFLGGHKLHDQLVAYTEDYKAVCFHLYRHPRTFELTGIVTYCNGEDTESYRYGRKLVAERPEKF